MKYTAIVCGERIELELRASENGGIDAEIGGRQYALDVMPVQPAVYWLSWKNRSIEVTIVPEREGYLVSINGEHVPVEILDARAVLRKASQQSQTGAVELRAPMPGKIVRRLLAEGEEVGANQGVVVMEAMKMQNEIKSPKKGIVKKIMVTEGSAVNAGDLLAIVD